MKRFFALFLAMLMLTLCACGSTNTPAGSGMGNGNGGSRSDPTEETAPLIDYEAPMLALTVKINPEFEITLNYMATILSVKPLNADAEALFAALDVAGQGYYDGMTTILEEAKTQGYLQDGAEVSITAEEQQNNGWTVASQQLLQLPIEDFMADNNTSVGCKITPAGKVTNPKRLKHGKTIPGEDPIGAFSCAFYYDNAGYNVMNILTYKDGTRREIYFPRAHTDGPVTTERIVITYYPDGSYMHEHYLESQYSSYTQYPDGSRETFIGRGNWSRHESRDGTIHEVTTDSNGTVIDEKIIPQEG